MMDRLLSQCVLFCVSGLIMLVALFPQQMHQAALARSAVMTTTWFADHPAERARVLALCHDNPGEGRHNPNCENAEAGELEAATRTAVARSHLGVSPDNPAYWRDPANAGALRFWRTECARAAARHASAQALSAMSCPAIWAAVGG
jgi:hypothetical protein